MLDKLPDKISHVGFIIFCSLNKWVECAHFLFNFSFIEWHELIGEQLMDISGDQIIVLKVSSVERLQDVHQINLLVVIWADQQIDYEALEELVLQSSISI